MAARCGSLRPPLFPSSPAPSPSSSGAPRLVGLLRAEDGDGTGRRFAPRREPERRTAARGVASAKEASYLSVVEEARRTTNEGATLGGAALSDAAKAVLDIIRQTAAAAGRRSWALQAEKMVESAVVNCRFFTLIAVAGTLVGAVLCFVEGCSLVAEAFFEYFRAAALEKLDQAEVMTLLIEALDMFLVGSAMLSFGMGFHTMFVGSREHPRVNAAIPDRLAVGTPCKTSMMPAAAEMRCVSEAKARLGRAVLTLLQAGAVEKFKNVPMRTGPDLACFAGAVLVSAVGLFLLSRLHTRRAYLPEEGSASTSTSSPG